MSPNEAITKQQFVRRVNAICREAWDRVVENFAEYEERHAAELGERALFAKAVRLPLMSGIDFHIFDAIRLLGSPPGEEGAIEEVIGPMQYAVEQTQMGPPIHSVETIVEDFGDFNRKARAYGLDDCLVDRAHLRPIES